MPNDSSEAHSPGSEQPGADRTARMHAWLDRPVVNGLVAAFRLGRLYSCVRFDLYQAYVLYAVDMLPESAERFRSALQWLELLLETSPQFNSVTRRRVKQEVGGLRDGLLANFAARSTGLLCVLSTGT